MVDDADFGDVRPWNHVEEYGDCDAMEVCLRGRLPLRFVVYRTRRGFEKAVREKGRKDWKNLGGVCESWVKWNNLPDGRKGPKTPSHCVIRLDGTSLGGGIVAHEILHALCYMARAKGAKQFPNGRTEETLCTALGNYVCIFFNWYYTLHPECEGKRAHQCSTSN